MTDKGITLAVLSVLKYWTDKAHPLHANEISAKMSPFGLNPDRRTIGTAINTLKAFGYNVTQTSRGYYLYECGIDNGILKLLTDTVDDFPFITAEQTEVIKKTLTDSLPWRDEQKFLNVRDSNTHKTVNKETLQTIATLTQAINSRKKVSFDYKKYDYDDKQRKLILVSHADGRITADPYFLDFFNKHYYLICFNPNHDKYPNNLRVDRMADVKILEEDVENHFSPEILTAAVTHSVYAFTGAQAAVRMYVDEKGLQAVVDEFGTDITVNRADDRRLYVIVKASLAGMKYWALQYLDHVEVIYPQSLRDAIITSLQKNKYLNKPDTEQK